MKRRTMLALTAASLTLPGPAPYADEQEYVPYSRDAYEAAMASGEPVLLDFYAPW